MNCELIREAIDTGNKSEAVQRHLTGCSDCTEWSSLLALLGTQPRVNAPSDFDTRLQARLASEEVRLLTLVNSLPLVAAPADFDFRLRARLARAKAAQVAQRPLAWLAEFRANSFSLGQAATGLAAVALIVAFSAVQLTRNGNQPATASTEIAKVDTGKLNVAVPPTVSVDASAAVRAQSPKSPSVRVHQALSVAAKGFAATPVADKLVASNAAEQSVFDSVKRQEAKIQRGRVAYFGQELAKTAFAAPKAEQVSVAF